MDGGWGNDILWAFGGDTLEGESGAVVLGLDLLGIEAAERL